MYIFGGKSNGYMNDLVRFNMRTGVWIHLGPLPPPRPKVMPKPTPMAAPVPALPGLGAAAAAAAAAPIALGGSVGVVPSATPALPLLRT